MNVRVAGIVVIDRDPLELCAEVPLHPGHKVAGMLPQIHPLCVFRRYDDRPHQAVGALPCPYRCGHIEVFAFTIKALAALALPLGLFARQIARMPDPAAVMPIAPEGCLDHAPPSVRASQHWTTPQAAPARARFWLAPHH